MQIRTYPAIGLMAFALSMPFGCGESDNNGAATAGSGGTPAGTTGQGGSTAGVNNVGGIAGRNPGTSGSGPTGCEGLMPAMGEECDDLGIVCPSELGSCVCQRDGGQRAWECFEIGVGEGGSGNAMGGAGPGGEGPGGEGPGGQGGSADGGTGNAGGGDNAGAGGVPSSAGGAGGEGGS